jgi:hypothetical protein
MSHLNIRKDPDGLRLHATAVADWLNTQIPGTAEHLTMPSPLETLLVQR